MSAWSDFYKTRMTEVYRLKFAKKYSLFIDLIESQIKTNAMRIEEHGCGIGTVTKLIVDLRKKHVRHLLFDSDPEILDMCRKNVWGPAVSQMLHDVRDQIAFGADLIHSHGLLEHMNDDDIRKVIALQRSRCPTLIHYVPSARYEAPSFGDERLMSPEMWQKICEPESIISFNNGHDLILTWGLR